VPPPPQKVTDRPVQTADPMPLLASKADVVVKDMEAGAPVSMKVGQTLGIVGSTAAVSWQVDYTGQALKMLTPADKVNKPGVAGWVWRAMESGTVEIALTSRAPCPNPPCESNPAKYTMTVEIKLP
jgi:predicted secreted protein